MQPKSWRERYQPLDALAGSEVTFRGRDPRSSAPVLVHLLGAAAGPSRAVLHEIMALPHAAYMHVVEFGEEGDTCYVVTNLQLGEVAIGEWLRRARSGAVPLEERPTEEIAIPVLPPPAAPRAPQEPGEFTRLFKPATNGRSASSAPTVEPVAAAPPGEFTSIFSAPTAPPLTLPVATRQNGELTSLFDRKSTPPAIEPRPVEKAPMPAPLPSPEPGDFTRLLGIPPAPAPAPVAAPPTPTPPAPVDEPGEYTLLVTRQSADPTPPPAPRPVTQPARRSDLRPILIFSALATIAVVLILLAALGR